MNYGTLLSVGTHVNSAWEEPDLDKCNSKTLHIWSTWWKSSRPLEGELSRIAWFLKFPRSLQNLSYIELADIFCCICFGDVWVHIHFVICSAYAVNLFILVLFICSTFRLYLLYFFSVCICFAFSYVFLKWHPFWSCSWGMFLLEMFRLLNKCVAHLPLSATIALRLQQELLGLQLSVTNMLGTFYMLLILVFS